MTAQITNSVFSDFMSQANTGQQGMQPFNNSFNSGGEYQSAMELVNGEMSDTLSNFEMVSQQVDQDLGQTMGQFQQQYSAAQEQQADAEHTLNFMQDPVEHGDNGEAVGGLIGQALTNPIGAIGTVVTDPIGTLEDVGGTVVDAVTDPIGTISDIGEGIGDMFGF